MDDMYEPEPYDNARKMRELRKRRAELGLGKLNEERMFTRQHMWWKGQVALATSYEMESLIARDDAAAISLIANLYVKGRAKLGEAQEMVALASDTTRELAQRHQEAVSSQLRYHRDGKDAHEARDFSMMEKHFAMEYVMYVRASGWKNLIRYYEKGEARPRIADDV